MTREPEHTIEFLLAFNGHVHWYAEGYFTKFEIKRVSQTIERPHGLRYSLTLHGPEGGRLIGFDNAHAVAAGPRFTRRAAKADHWHRDAADEGRSYVFTDAATLVFDFFLEVERVLTERGVPLDVMRMEQRTRGRRP